MTLSLHIQPTDDINDDARMVEEGEIRDAPPFTKFLMNLKLILDGIKEVRKGVADVDSVTAVQPNFPKHLTSFKLFKHQLQNQFFRNTFFT